MRLDDLAQAQRALQLARDHYEQAERRETAARREMIRCLLAVLKAEDKVFVLSNAEAARQS